MKKTRLIGLGAGGHAKVVIEILRADGRYEIVGLLDVNKALKGKTVLGIPVIGDDTRLPALRARGITHFFVGLGSVASAAARRSLYLLGLRAGFKPVSAIHPTAVLSPSARAGQGLLMMPRAIVNASVGL